MKRPEQHEFNARAIQRVAKVDTGRWCRAPRYRIAVSLLNGEGFTTSRGNPWTLRSLYRMLQRERFRGLYGLFEMKKKGIFGHVGAPAATSTRAKAVQTERQVVKGIC